MADQKDLVTVKMQGGKWAKLYPELLHGTARRVEAANRKYLRFSTGSVKVEEGQTIQDAAKGVEVILDIANADFTEANDMLILGQVAEWSFGEVAQEVLDGIPEALREQMLKECDRLYSSRPLTGSGGKG